MEIERKWVVSGWPEKPFPLLKEEEMEQGYVSVRPTVRIRKEAVKSGGVRYMLCFKSEGRLARKEIEFPISEDHYAGLKDLIGLPLIGKIRRTYLLPDGMKLEVNLVDPELPTAFWYAEVEYPSVQEARDWDPENVGLGTYLSEDVTELPGQSMGEYWVKTRLAVPESERR